MHRPSHAASEVTPMMAREIRALELLLRVAKGDSGQGPLVADFLLAWWCSREMGAWDPTKLWELEQETGEAIVAVLGYIQRSRVHPATLGFAEEFSQLIRIWRGATGN